MTLGGSSFCPSVSIRLTFFFFSLSLSLSRASQADNLDMDLLWTAMGRYAVEDQKLQQLCQRVHEVDQTLLILVSLF